MIINKLYYPKKIFYIFAAVENKENIEASALKQPASQSSADSEKSKADLKKERRALQEAQRAAKEKAALEKAAVAAAAKKSAAETSAKAAKKIVKEAAPKKKTVQEGGSGVPFVEHLNKADYVLPTISYSEKIHTEFELMQLLLRVRKEDS